MKRLAISAGMVIFSLGMAGQNAPVDWDWVLHLSRVKHHLRDNFERIPNYVCQETVERFQDSRGHTVKVDTLQFDVAQVDHKELFAIPGSHGFEDRELSSYVSTGVLGTGSFSSMPMNLFVADRARIVPHKGAANGASEELGYDYEIPAFLHGYEITSQGATAWVGERGTFWVNAENMDLIRIDQHVVDVPPKVGITEIDSTVEYARMEIGSSSVLLPKSAELVAVNLDGTAQRNQLKFSGCRAYVIESTISFGGSVDLAPVTKKK